MFSTVRGRALLKLAFLVAVFWLLRVLQSSLLSSGGSSTSKAQALHVLPLVLCLVPILELLLGTPFREISSRWNTYSSLRQWGTLLFVLLALFSLFAGVTALLVAEP